MQGDTQQAVAAKKSARRRDDRQVVRPDPILRTLRYPAKADYTVKRVKGDYVIERHDA